MHVLVEVLDAQAKKIEFEKLKAIGARNLVESETENRQRRQLALQSQINEKMAELDRSNRNPNPVDATYFADGHPNQPAKPLAPVLSGQICKAIPVVGEGGSGAVGFDRKAE